MKIANLVLAHKSPQQLERLIKSLNHPGFDIYIHLDKKTDPYPFEYLIQYKNVFFIKNRIKLYRADFSGVQATINGFEEIIKKQYDYVNLISGQDFPIKPIQYIYDYIEERKGKEFISCENIETEWTESIPRIKKYHLIHWRIPGKYKIGFALDKILPARKFPLNYDIVGRSQWFTISIDAVSYILDFLKKEPSVSRYFKYCWGSDEFIFATILFNNPDFKKKIVPNLMYVDWTGSKEAHPRTLTVEDYEKLKNSPQLFARKFDIMVDEKIVSQVEKLIE